MPRPSPERKGERTQERVGEKREVYHHVFFLDRMAQPLRCGVPLLSSPQLSIATRLLAVVNADAVATAMATVSHALRSQQLLLKTISHH